MPLLLTALATAERRTLATSSEAARVQNLLDRLGDAAVGEGQDLLRLGHGLAANQVDDDTSLAGRDADVTRDCFSFHRSLLLISYSCRLRDP